MYSGILGTVGALVPFTTRDDVDFFTHLEMYVVFRIAPARLLLHAIFEAQASLQIRHFLRHSFCFRYVRQEAHSVVGRDHLMYRSYYVPVKDVIDGDLYTPTPSLIFFYLPFPSLFWPSDTVLPVASASTFWTLPSRNRSTATAGNLERMPGEVAEKLKDMRNRLL